jgi:TPR repeat protein
MFYNGKGTIRDFTKAKSYFEKACNYGEDQVCKNHKGLNNPPIIIKKSSNFMDENY